MNLTKIGHIFVALARINSLHIWEYDRYWAYFCLEIRCNVSDQYVRCEYDQDRAHSGPSGPWGYIYWEHEFDRNRSYFCRTG